MTLRIPVAMLANTALAAGAVLAQPPGPSTTHSAASQQAPITAPATRAQQIVQQILTSHPEILILVIRAKPVNGTQYVVVGSNIGRFGTPAGKDDLKVLRTGEMSLEEDLAKGRYEVEPALTDRSGRILGTMSVVFPFDKGTDPAPMIALARRICAEASSGLKDNNDLFRPPYDPSPPLAPGATHPLANYGSFLLAKLALRYPALVNLAVQVPSASEPRSPQVIALNPVVGPVNLSGLPTAQDRPIEVKTEAVTHRTSISAPLLNVVGETVGTLTATFVSPAQSDSDLIAETVQIRDWVRRRVLDAGNLFDPYSYETTSANATYSQHLLDHFLRIHPEILVLALHAQPSKSASSVILASNFGRINKKDDAADLKIVSTGQPVATPSGKRINIGLPLHDMLGATIGLMTVAFACEAGCDQRRLLDRATSLRDEMSRRLLDKDSLTEPYPYDLRHAASIQAQLLLEDAFRKHPHVLGLGMHVTPPDSGANVIIASTFGRVGKASDESDLKMMQSNKHNMAVWAGGRRYSGQVILHDDKGNNIGSLLLIFPYRAGEDQMKLLEEANAIEAGLASKIPSTQFLLAPVPAPVE